MTPADLFPPEAAQTCGGCAHFAESAGAQYELRPPFGRCDLERINGRETKSAYKSPFSACQFEPVRYTEKTP